MVSKPLREGLFMARKSVPEQFAKKAACRKPQERVSPRPGYIDVSKATDARLVGYARVSTDEQTTRLQLDKLKAAGCHRIFQDKLGGALASRPQLDRALGELRAGRMLYSVLGAVAQFERDVLRERTVAGIRAAQARGEHVGRPRALTASQVREARKMLD